MILNSNITKFEENVIEQGNAKITIDGVETNLGYYGLQIKDESFYFTTTEISLEEAYQLIANSGFDEIEISGTNSYVLNDFFPGRYTTPEVIRKSESFDSGGQSGGGRTDEVFATYLNSSGTQLSNAIFPHCTQGIFYEYASGFDQNNEYRTASGFFFDNIYRINPTTVVIRKLTTNNNGDDVGRTGALKIELHQQAKPIFDIFLTN